MAEREGDSSNQLLETLEEWNDDLERHVPEFGGGGAMSDFLSSQPSLAPTFQQATAPARRRPPSPFCLRLTGEERSRLETLAGTRPLGAYIRSRVFGESAAPRRATRRPSADQKQLALLLAGLGQSRLASNLNQIAKAANTGTLDASPELRAELHSACNEIRTMREILIAALGIKPEDGT